MYNPIHLAQELGMCELKELSDFAYGSQNHKPCFYQDHILTYADNFQRVLDSW
jgi:hypothetical protein